MIHNSKQFSQTIYDALIQPPKNEFPGDILSGANDSYIRVETSKGLVTVISDSNDILVKQRVQQGDDESDVLVGPSFRNSGLTNIKSYLEGVWSSIS